MSRSHMFMLSNWTLFRDFKYHVQALDLEG